jgi:serine/threonine protein kinase
MVMDPSSAIDERGAPPDGHATSGSPLPAGTRLREYEITGVIVQTGFSIVYTAWDDALRRKVAVKEFMPAALAARAAGSTILIAPAGAEGELFQAGLKSFVAEARLLARFDHASLVKVYRFWEENGTAYTVMPFYEGPLLSQALAELDHVPGEAELRTWLRPILDAVAQLHDGGAVHHNVGPDNIVLTSIGPVLLGLGAARHVVAEMRHAPGSALMPGFAAIEQYGSAAQTTRGPWTDLYALGAVVYTAVTGAPPAAAADRLADDRVRPLGLVAAGLYGERFLAAVDAALAVEPARRPRDHRQFRALMGDIEAPEPVQLAPPRDLMHEPFAGASDEPREITVPDHPLLSLGEPAAKPAGKAQAPAAAPSAAAAPRAVPPSRSGLDAVPAPAVEAEASPSWMRSRAAMQRLLDKRMAYGVVAASCALIGIAALALQFQARPAGPATQAAAVPSPAMAASSVALPAATAPAVAAPAAIPEGTASAVTPPVPALPAVAAATPSAATPAPVGVAPAPASAALPPTASSRGVVASAVAAAAPSSPAAASKAAAVPVPAASAPAPTTADDLRPPANEGERIARCTEILQKASLERITAGETEFYKRECK